MGTVHGIVIAQYIVVYSKILFGMYLLTYSLLIFLLSLIQAFLEILIDGNLQRNSGPALTS